ncbi:MAG: hypothetical protein JF586_11550 [Burkholderiales bacterium]|jgi:hypothetical protein|nr:hypothetical protein [Burkholderiales bacterium]
MTPIQFDTAPSDLLDPWEPSDDTFLSQFDDAVLEQALKTVHWHPKDVSQFLRETARR